LVWQLASAAMATRSGVSTAIAAAATKTEAPNLRMLSSPLWMTALAVLNH
jgi:hypothetical protein